MNRPLCFVCGALMSEQTYPYQDIGWTDYGIFDGLSLHHCATCGVGVSLPELDDATLGSYYENQYRAKHSTFYLDFSASVPRAIGDISDSRAFSQILLARAFCEFGEGEAFLDIGPGVGGSFKMAKALLPRPDVCAVELSRGVTEFYRKNYGAVTYTSLGEFVAAGKRAKILLMSHSLEHYRLSDLASLFAELRRALDDDGVLLIEVPHADLRLHAEVRGVDTPHFLFFSRDSLVRLLQRHGFDVAFADTCGEVYGSPEQQVIDRSQSSRAKAALKPMYNKLPIGAQAMLRTAVRRIRAVRNAVRLRRPEKLALPIHSYGGNRNCLRLVAKKR